jgi:hypothetical protein
MQVLLKLICLVYCKIFKLFLGVEANIFFLKGSQDTPARTFQESFFEFLHFVHTQFKFVLDCMAHELKQWPFIFRFSKYTSLRPILTWLRPILT